MSLPGGVLFNVRTHFPSCTSSHRGMFAVCTFSRFHAKNVVIVMLNAPRCRINNGGASFNCDLYLHAGVFPANNYFGQRSTIFLDGLYSIFQQMSNLHFIYL
jgi:hypothetical protein